MTATDGSGVQVGVLAETADGERRVALTPDGVVRLARSGLGVLVQRGAGERAWCSDTAYADAGARLVERAEVYAGADVLTCVQLPHDVSHARPGQLLVGLLGLLPDAGLAHAVAETGVTALSFEGLPRTVSRAQSMDALTSQATVAGYKAALLAADTYGGFFPMLITAAGTSRPAQVLVIGAGVAGLQALSTARRLGAVVTGYDVRDAARAEVLSTGATFLDLGVAVTATGEGGYARQLTDEEREQQRAAFEQAVGRFDVVITTAQVPGRRPPTLVTAAALRGMRPGSVVVDLACGERGGNVDGSVPGAAVVTDGGVTVLGAGDLPARVPAAASTAYARNVVALLDHVAPDGAPSIDPQDEIQRGLLVTRGGRVVHPAIATPVEAQEGISS